MKCLTKVGLVEDSPGLESRLSDCNGPLWNFLCNLYVQVLRSRFMMSTDTCLLLLRWF